MLFLKVNRVDLAVSAPDVIEQMVRLASGDLVEAGLRRGYGRAASHRLSEQGIAGHSHILMMARNNAEVARLIQPWLQRRGLSYPAVPNEEAHHA